MSATPERDEFPCHDCDVPTAPIVGPHEWYTVHDLVWARARARPDSILCIGCVETRLGRRLTHGDFLPAALNDPAYGQHSARLKDRLRRDRHPSNQEPSMSPPPFTFREATADDQRFLTEMLIEAAHASGQMLRIDTVPDTDSYRYVADWGTPTDLGVIAHDRSGRPAGAAWLRLFDRSIGSPAFIDEHTPELTIATTASARGRGVGTALLHHLQTLATHAGLPALSLGVHRDNQPAQRLYRTHGWTPHTMAGDYRILVKHLR